MVFAIVVGPDGSGKTTALESLQSVEDVTITSISPDFLYPVPEAPWHDWMVGRHPREFFFRMKPVERASFLLTTLAVEVEYYLLPALDRGEDVICDSYWYRLQAKLELDAPEYVGVLASYTSTLPRPDLVIEIELDPARAWARKNGAISKYEAAGEGSDLESFVEFQTAVQSRVREFVAGVPFRLVDGIQSSPQIARMILDMTKVAPDKRVPLHAGRE